jgi:Arc/MetJ-type ribon-helix-helix transcriptional regulator
MALPAAAVIQSTISTYLKRHEVVETELTREDAAVVEERESADADGSNEDGIFGRLSARWRRPEA